MSMRSLIKLRVFQSTSPVRGTTPMAKRIANVRPISIHVPREGDDAVPRRDVLHLQNFNQRQQ